VFSAAALVFPTTCHLHDPSIGAENTPNEAAAPEFVARPRVLASS
jgi:hypothetical protein